mmetsp:Transcript_10603/g.25526  ORF Transcript_10603/g.25526 Transcript_10603/m.25526 type:complete len:379 (-) Transcript_10603:47-1183(-)
MSAYALPGFFPPIDTMSPSCFSGTTYVDNSSSTNGESASSESNIPLHLQDQERNYDNKCKIGNRRNDIESDEVTSTTSSNIGCILNSAAIAVKEAKIDPVRWIQYVTGSNPQRYAHKIGKTLRRRVSNSGIGNPSGTRTTRQSNGILVETNKSSCNDNEKSQQNEAIEFELSITFNGRKYTAKRTMHCIMQLRDDLIREMRRRRQWLIEKEDSSTSPCLKLTHMDSFGGHLSFTRPFNHKNRTSGERFKVEEEGKHIETIQIPEIPPFTTDNDRRHLNGDTGFVGKGFSMLHAMVKSYVPVMEGWLKNVMEIVPQDSECLTNFLWEPATEMSSACFKSVLDTINQRDELCASSKTFKSSTSLATLGSIKEMDYDTEDE